MALNVQQKVFFLPVNEALCALCGDVRWSSMCGVRERVKTWGGFVTTEGILSVQTINICTSDYIILLSVVIFGHKSRFGAFFFPAYNKRSLCTHICVEGEGGLCGS